jgi:hypothetical protein
MISPPKGLHLILIGNDGMNGKYKGISDETIREGLDQGRFSEGNVRQIRDEEGKFVKHIKENGKVSTRLPVSVIQVNHQYVYQADLRPIIEAMIDARREQLIEDLGDRYELVLSKLERYINHRKGIEDLVVASNDASTIFQKRLRLLLEEFQPRDPDVTAGKTLVSVLKAYINIQFVYLISTFWSDRKSVDIDTAIPRRLNELEKAVLEHFEQLLAYRYDPKQRLWLRDTLYAKYLLQGREGITHLEAFLIKDRRFDSLTGFLQFVTKNFLTYTGEKDWYGNPSGDASFGIDITIDQTPFEHDKRHTLACDFSDLLTDIDQLWNLYNELRGAGNIEPEDILISPESAQLEAKKLTAIPLQLPSMA